MNNILILGSGGFLGRHLAQALSSVSGNNISGFGFPTTDPGAVGKYYPGDLRTGEGLDAALEGQDTVFHLISQTIPASSWNSPGDEIELNLRPTVNLIEKAAEHGVRRICYASSGGTVYGMDNESVDEDSRTEPFSPYGIIKRASESLLEYARHRHGMTYEVYRISNIYGEGQDVSKGLGIINTSLHNILSGRPITIYGDGKVVRDFIYVKDVARLMAESSSLHDGRSGIYNVSSNHSVDVNQLLAVIEKIVGKKLDIKYEPGRNNDNRTVRINNSRILERTGNIELTNLEDGIKATWDFMQARSMYAKESV